MLVRSALKVAPDEHVVVFDDAESRAIGDAIAEAADGVGAWVRRVRLDRIATRPLRSLPEAARAAMTSANASVFVASALPLEASMRQALLHLVRERGLRHAHMPGITERGFIAGARVAYDEIARTGERVLDLVSRCKTITAESPGGTLVRVTLGETARWFAQLGTLTAGEWGNLPGGALYTSPADVEGVFVADASLGEFFGARAGLLASDPVRLTIVHGRVVDIEAPADLARDIRATLDLGQNSDRIGLVAIGINYGIDRATGEAGVDQNMPGLHLGIGDPSGRMSGATWRAQTCFAACQSASSVAVDGSVLVRDGALVGAAAPRASTRPQMARSFSPVPR